MFVLTLPAGDISDRFDQRRVLSVTQAMQSVCAGLFLLLILFAPPIPWPYYAVLVLFGATRGFYGPASQSLLPFLVPPEKLPRAIAASSSVFTTATIAGPALGGLLFALGSVWTFAVALVLMVAASVLTASLGGRQRPPHVDTGASRFERVREGIDFVRRRPVVLGAISLDLFAVLLGGATALLPAYAKDILHVGPVGLGVLRSGPAVGAALMAFSLARWPIQRRTGIIMFRGGCGVRRRHHRLRPLDQLLSLAGGARRARRLRHDQRLRALRLIQYATPDAMRGRVSAVSMLFIGASNELGEFESGITADWFGTIASVVIGGIGTLVVVAAWMALFPPLRKIDRLADAATAPTT